MNFICPKCGCSYESDTAKCPYCGFAPKKQAAKQTKLVCSNCGFSYEADTDTDKCPFCESVPEKRPSTARCIIEIILIALVFLFIIYAFARGYGCLAGVSFIVFILRLLFPPLFFLL